MEIQMKIPTMDTESDHKYFYQNSSITDQNKSDVVKKVDYQHELQKMKRILQESEEKLKQKTKCKQWRKKFTKITKKNEITTATQNFRYHEN